MGLDSYPTVTIVTPSYNMGRFIEATIESVLSQDYPRIEYIIMDGGSTDGTVEILRRYEGALTWHSQHDNGAGDAINRGFELSHGNIFAYLNADDFYLPGAVSTAVRHLCRDAAFGAVYGNAQWIDEQGEVIREYPSRDFNRDLLLRECFICQPACFMRRDAFESAGRIDPHLRFTFDYELWLRMSRTYPLLHIPEYLAGSRMYRHNKTLGSRRAALRETIEMLRNTAGYAPYGPVHAYTCYVIDHRDQFFEPLRPSALKHVAAFFTGLWLNTNRPGAYLADVAKVMSGRARARTNSIP